MTTRPCEPQLELTILMPCLDEAETLAACVRKAQRFLETSGIYGEVLVSDNGSTDGSPELARELGARVIQVDTRGYGAALAAGIAEARGRFTIMGDADDSYDFSALMPFLEKLRDGWQLVMGNRFEGGIAQGAMPALHRYLGNPVLSGLGRLLFTAPVRDFHCGLRGFDTEAVRALGLETTGMEFASEMVVRSALAGLRITEVPTTLSPAGRTRPPHLRSWRDGWRHLRFLMMYSPSWLFLYPGIALMLAGLAGVVTLSIGEVTIARVTFGVHTLLYSTLSVVIGFESFGFGRFLTYIGTRSGELPESRWLARIELVLTLERSLGLAALLLLGGAAGSVYAFATWSSTGFGVLSPTEVMRVTIPSVGAIILGAQTALSAFFMYALHSGPGHDR